MFLFSFCRRDQQEEEENELVMIRHTEDEVAASSRLLPQKGGVMQRLYTSH